MIEQRVTVVVPMSRSRSRAYRDGTIDEEPTGEAQSMLRTPLTFTAALLLAAFATNPATGKKQLMLVSEAQEIAMGKEADQEAVASYGLYPDEQVQAYVSALGTKLAKASERPSLPWSFKVVDDSSVN